MSTEKMTMLKEKIRSVDWQRVADWCVHLFWRNSGWVLILIVFAPVGLTHVLERFNQTLLPIVMGAVLIGLAGLVAMGIFGMLLALFYIVQFKYRYSKSTPFKILVTCLVLGGLASIAMSEIKQRAISVYQWQFIGTSKAIFEQLNANRQSTQAADT
jgi:RsiW-degrading membrane proteinase PrsW (M82 family)